MSNKEIKIDDFEEDTCVENIDNEEAVFVPSPQDEGWTEYVLNTILREDEKYEGNPTVDGLRRAVECLYGEIIIYETEVVKAPSMSDPSSTVIVRIELGEEGNYKRVEACADANIENTNSPYNKYLVAMAETRAEARALRKMLRLKQVVAAEELSNFEEDENLKNQLASDTQIKALDVMCSKERADINIIKLVNKIFPKCDNINMLSKEEMLELLKIVSDYQSNEAPKGFSGYDKLWQNSFCN